MKLLKNLLKSPMFVIGMSLFLVTILIAIFGPLFYAINTDRVGVPYDMPNAQFWLGLDNYGRDYVSLLIRGLGSSLYVGVIAGVIATTIGTLIGLYGGFKGGLADDILSVLTNLFVVIPQFVILILISTTFEKRSLALVAMIIGFTAWTWSARGVRAQAAALKSKDHISLARLNGDNTLKVLVVHILPYILSYVFMVFILQVSSGILSEAAISMIGLGPTGDNAISLGVILNDANRYGGLSDKNWHAFIPATCVISALVFALYLINTSMEGVFNPRLRK
ncbi:MAG: ABC transporter permease [Chitinispirillia bacterium]|nr:ABC transporter permease [Chitinispirillia bacterium]MCL2242097.1 ABC transporter permease [Chitinispirillia bacterium]